MSSKYLQSLLPRRSIYALSKNNFPLKPKQVATIVEQTIKHTPSSFNSQSNRAIVLFGKNHDKLWGKFAVEALKPQVVTDAWPQTAAKLKGFENAFGTVLFFEDENTIKKMQDQYPFYAEKFPSWAAHSSGAAQIHVWTALAEDGVGANLQHYNPLIDDAVKTEWHVPSSWNLTAQLVFGTIEKGPGDKTSLPSEEVVKVHE